MASFLCLHKAHIIPKLSSRMTRAQVQPSTLFHTPTSSQTRATRIYRITHYSTSLVANIIAYGPPCRPNSPGPSSSSSLSVVVCLLQAPS